MAEYKLDNTQTHYLWDVRHEPIQVEGALFSCGDGHAVQGDGEVCVTALEAPVDAKLRFTLIKGKTGASPSFFTPSPLLPKTDTCGWQGTTG